MANILSNFVVWGPTEVAYNKKCSVYYANVNMPLG